MPKKNYKILRNFKGVNRAISKRDSHEYLQTLENMDSNLEEGMLISRNGATAKQSSGATPNIDKFVMYRDEDWQKDVCLVYDKDSTAASRKIYVYTRTIDTDNSFAPHSTASYSYGSLRFGDQLSFLVHRNAVRIGTGTASTNKAMFAGYINRAIGSDHDAMFNDQIAFNDFFLCKQQWVQQADCFSNGFVKVRYDSTREKFYVLTTRGLEIRDSDLRIEQVLNDVVSWAPAVSTGYHDVPDLFYVGGVEIIGNNLYVLGIEPNIDSGTDLVTKIVSYDMSNGYEISTTSISKTSTDLVYPVSTGDLMFGISTDGTSIFVVWTDNTDSFLSIYTSALALTADKVYTNSGVTTAWDCTALGNYVYVIDDDNDNVIQVLKSSPYTAVTYSPTITAGYLTAIENDGTDLILTDVSASQTDVYTIAIASPFSSSTLETTKTFSSRQLPGSSCISTTPYLFDNNRGELYKYDGTTNWNITNIYPGKVSVQAFNTRYIPNETVGQDSLYYAVSIVDIYGQESHLMRGCHSNRDVLTNIVRNSLIRITIDAASETYASEITSPSTDPTSATSIWNEFRRIKKIRIYRAHYAENFSEAEPTTNYTFLKEIDINDTNWDEDVNNQTYKITVHDTVLLADTSTVTYEESSGLPESFKPYYTNWQYGTNYQDRYYYGNVYTDETNAHEIIQTPINSPDIAYQHSTNIDYFYPSDGDEIKGFAQVWSRMVVFKGNNVAIYDELTKERVYSIGTSAPDSILVHNNIVYFVHGTGIYSLTPSGYERISEPVDTLLAAESSLTSVAGVYFKKKQKLWWLVPQSDSYCFNLNKGTWDIYDIQTGTRDVIWIGQGLDDTIFTSDQYDDKIYKEDTGANDGGAGNPIQISVITNDIAMGDGYLNATVTRLFVTSTSTDNVSLKTYWRNENGSSNVTKTFTKTSDLATTKKYVSSMWGQFIKFEITQTITAQIKIDSIGFEYFLQGKLQDAS